jgi:hypothetical protein
MILRLIGLFLLLLTSAGAQSITSIIPASQLPATGTWQGIAGIPGGIDQYSTNYTMFCNVKSSIPGTTMVAYGDGVHDDTAALNFAAQNCPNNEYVYLPAGTYLISAPISVSGVNKYDGSQYPYSIIIRGAGPTNTIILNNGGGSAITLAWWGGYGGGFPITAGDARGSTNISVASTSPYPVKLNEWLIVDRQNTNANVYLPAANDAHGFYVVYGGSADQMVKVTGISGTTFNIWPPLNEAHSTDQLLVSVSQPLHCGIENLCVVQMQEHGVPNIGLYGGEECWIRNVESRQSRGTHIFLDFCGGCEIRQCYVHEPFPNLDGADGGGSSDYGIDMADHTSSSLIVDNIALHCRHSFIMEQGCGQDNVVAYNYGKDNINEGLFETTWQEDTDYHGGEPRYNLWEGNVVPIFEADGVEGGTKYDVYFRNLVTRDGLPTVTEFMEGLDLDRGNYYDYFLDNVFFKCTANPAAMLYLVGHWQTDLTYNDPSVLSSCVWLGNYDCTSNKVDFSTNGVINWTGSVAATFPTSLLFTSKPSWYGTNVWPAFGSDVSGLTNVIPAQTRAWQIPGFFNSVADGNTLTLAANNGAASASGNGSSYFNGAWVMLNAAANAGYGFSGWSGYAVANSNSPNTYLVMPAANVSAAVNFIPGTSYLLTAINGTGSGVYVPGETVTVAATAQIGQQFAYWKIPSLNIVGTSTNVTITMPATNVTATAFFNALVPPLDLHHQ